jgi:hypothetical protein
MELDMHYYGTYAMARAAGLRKDVCVTLATAAQFVDDNADQTSLEFRDGARLDVEATAHHAANIRNIDPEDQRQIWVPFHFLPANTGDSYNQRLVCAKDSKIARKMIESNLKLLNQPFALQLLGITAHVYADTFSHYGFSGISAKENRVVNDSFRFYELAPEMERYITNKALIFKLTSRQCSFKQFIKSRLSEMFSRALGHGAVMTYPDRPYLKWDFVYENGAGAERCPLRDNPATYFECCGQLHELFQRVAKGHLEFSERSAFRGFSQIESVVRNILALQAPLQGRIKAWQDAAREGNLFGVGREEIPEYQEDSWLDSQEALGRVADSRLVPGLPAFLFYQAASVHRTNIIRHLLPDQGLIVA